MQLLVALLGCSTAMYNGNPQIIVENVDGSEYPPTIFQNPINLRFPSLAIQDTHYICVEGRHGGLGQLFTARRTT